MCVANSNEMCGAFRYANLFLTYCLYIKYWISFKKFNKYHSFWKNKIASTITLTCILSPPCQNNGVCTDGQNGAYTCTCANGYTGKNCDKGKYAFSRIFIRKLYFIKISQKLNESIKHPVMHHHVNMEAYAQIQMLNHFTVVHVKMAILDRHVE